MGMHRSAIIGLNEIEYKHPWVLMLDADEVVDDALATEIRKSLLVIGGSNIFVSGQAKRFPDGQMAPAQQRISNLVRAVDQEGTGMGRTRNQ
jgi:hypothetical protein